ncbi:HesB/IscA family protein [Empedobacter brevis]|uniref:HesB/IscA family protein n=1 Tax=Empedobacter brevis TaxID=247 RepID=UPI0028A61201|nr:iron-sulfur cluster assembly accessory protein [Empedobacter brevis]
MIKVSESAKNKIIALLQEEGTSIEESFVRVGVTSGGCSGLNYNLEFTKEQRPEDKVFDDNGVKVLVDKKSFLYLVGMTLEYSGGLNGKGFIFNNPNASRTCGCGESFAV